MSARVLLVVDDNPADAALLQEAISELKLQVDFHWIENAPKAFDFLLQRGQFANKPAIDLLLLDINMPILSGHQMHELMRKHPQLHRVRVAFWSTSSRSEDRSRAIAAGAMTYLVKPADFDGLKALARQLHDLLEASAA
jgi:two-component system, chemotaxis family, response regulator Rcp1